MALSYKARRRLAILILVLGLPIYIMLAVAIMVWLGRPPLVVEFFVYVLLGIIWAFPLKFVFKGVGQADPDADQPDQKLD